MSQMELGARLHRDPNPLSKQVSRESIGTRDTAANVFPMRCVRMSALSEN